MEKIYYVYFLLDPREKCDLYIKNKKINYKPFYIGKGSGKRVISSINEGNLTRNILENKITEKIKYIRNILSSNNRVEYLIFEKSTNEEYILNLEAELINYFIDFDIFLTNRKTTTSGSSIKNKKINLKYRKERIKKDNKCMVFIKDLNEHRYLTDKEIELVVKKYGKNSIEFSSKINTRQFKTKNKNKSRLGKNNGMYGKSAILGRVWINNGKEEKFITKTDISKYIGFSLGRITKPTLKRVICKNEKRSCYMSDEDIHNLIDIEYQYGLIWSSNKDTYKNGKIIIRGISKKQRSKNHGF